MAQIQKRTNEQINADVEPYISSAIKTLDMAYSTVAFSGKTAEDMDYEAMIIERINDARFALTELLREVS